MASVTQDLGRFLRGQRVPLTVRVGRAPDEAPTVRLYRAGTLLDTLKLPVVDRREFLFEQAYLLTAAMADGNYLAAWSYALASSPRAGLFAFGVYGGVGRPPVVAVQEFRRPLGRAVVTVDEAGEVRLGYNPARETS